MDMPGVLVGGTWVECRLVLFDLDGTLVDKEFRNRSLAEARHEEVSRVAGAAAARRWAELSGVDEEFNVDMRGPLSKAPRREDLTVAAAAIWLEGLDWFKAKELAAQAYEAADRMQSRRYRPRLIPGAEDTLRSLRGAGLMLGIATNGSGRTAREIMGAVGVEELFDLYIGADEVAEGKPAPDMLVAACERLGVSPGDAVYVGDEAVDALAGEAAGVKGTVLVNPERGAAQYSSLVLDTVADIRARHGI
jgi:HAD superfamily hydrolase (TIGR01549 family)